MRKSLVSIVALGLFAGAPAMAQTATDEATTNQMQQQQTQQQGTRQQDTQQQAQQQAPSAEQMRQMLSAYQEQSEVDGFIARAADAEGNPVLVLVTPRDFEAGRDVQAQEDDVRERLEQSRFDGVEMLPQPTIVRAFVDENNQIIALAATRIVPAGAQMSGLSGQTGTQSGTQDQTATQSQTGDIGELGTTGSVPGGEPRTMMSEDEGESATGQTESQIGQTQPETGQTDTAMAQTDTEAGREATELGDTDTDTNVEMGQSDTVVEMDPETGATGEAQAQMDTEIGQAGRALSEAGTERIVSDLQQAGIENPAEFQGRIVRARTSDGGPVFFMISGQDMQAGAEGINEDEIRQNLQQADLQDIQFIGDAKLLRGDMEGDQVFVLAGSDLMGNAQQQ